MNPSIHPISRRERVRGRLRSLGRLAIDIHRPLFYCLLAAVMTFAVECLSRHSVTETLVFLWENPLAYLTNYGIILLTLLPALLFRKRLAGMVLLTGVWTALGIAEFVILCTRVSPLSAADIAIALSVLSIISSYLSIPVIILLVALIVGFVAAIVWLFVRVRKHPIRWRQFGIAYLSAVVGTVAVILLGFGTGNLSDRFPNLVNAYNDYGFPYCFTVSIVDQGVDRPDEYGEGLITDILDGMTDPEGEPPAGSTADRAPNVILVQLESFFDVQYIQNVTYSADPIPHFRALREQYPSGLLNVPVIGAGTVNTEFEVLTGMSTADFGAGEYPYRSILMDTTCESMAYDLLASGYRTHGIHNHEGSFYRRHEVYKNLGFESFTSIEYFKEPTFNENEWAHDALLTDEILYLLSSTEEADFVFAVSVQGHGKYPDEYEPKADDILVTSGMEDEAVRSHYNYYINQLHEMDAFVGALYDAVMALEEDTVLVLYGDHLPGIARDEGITLSTSDLQTEYIIIANYETPVTPAGGELYTYQLFPTVMEVIGNDEGVMNRFHRTYRNDPQYLTLLAALEYDVLYGNLMAYGGVPYPTMEDMTMGRRPIRITGYEARPGLPGEDGYLYIKGEGFTAYSVITLDGREKKTEFIDEHTLRMEHNTPTRLLERTEEITVRQITATNEMLSESDAYQVPHPASD